MDIYPRSCLARPVPLTPDDPLHTNNPGRRRFSAQQPPAGDDSYTVVEAAAPTRLDALVDDFDADGDAVTVTAVTQPPTGTVTLPLGWSSTPCQRLRRQ